METINNISNIAKQGNKSIFPFFVAGTITISAFLFPFVNILNYSTSLYGFIDYVKNNIILNEAANLLGFQTFQNCFWAFLAGSWLIAFGKYNLKNKLWFVSLFGMMLYAYVVMNISNIAEYLGRGNHDHIVNFEYGLYVMIVGFILLIFTSIIIILYQVIKGGFDGIKSIIGNSGISEHKKIYAKKFDSKEADDNDNNEIDNAKYQKYEWLPVVELIIKNRVWIIIITILIIIIFLLMPVRKSYEVNKTLNENAQNEVY